MARDEMKTSETTGISKPILEDMQRLIISRKRKGDGTLGWVYSAEVRMKNTAGEEMSVLGTGQYSVTGELSADPPADAIDKLETLLEGLGFEMVAP